MRLLKPHEIEGRVPEPSTAEKRKILLRLRKEQNDACYICGLNFDSWRHPVIEHIQPGKMGGCKSWAKENLAAACWQCNSVKGSKRTSNQGE